MPYKGPSNSILHRLWSKAVLGRDNRICQICGRTGTIHAHHGIVRAGKSLGARFIADNGISLCYDCHFHGAHSGDNHGRMILDRIEQWFINRLGQKRYDEIKAIGSKPCKMDAEEREKLREYLANYSEFVVGKRGFKTED